MELEYSNYLVLASHAPKLNGDYSSWINFKEVINILENMLAKQQTTYLYNENFYQSDLKLSEMQSIIKCVEEIKYSKVLDKTKNIANQIGLLRI